MSKSKGRIEPVFETALTKQALDKGELQHLDFEVLRKITMTAGLTNSSTELDSIFATHPEKINETLDIGLKTFEHYQVLLELIRDAISRIYAVSSNQPDWDEGIEIEEFEQKISRILSTEDNNSSH